MMLPIKLGVGKQVKFLGSLGHRELARAYNKASVFVLANEQEITPAVNEALACNVPVVVMECGGMSFVLPDSGYGLISKKYDVEDMAAKIVLLLKDRRLAGRMAAKGRERILKEFSIPVVAKKFYGALA